MADSLGWLRPKPLANGSVRESRLVQIGRWLLPLIALGLLAVALVWAEVSPDTEVKQAPDLSNVQNTLQTAKFSSTDAEGRPYVIEADQVVQQDASSMTATLSSPRGEITMKEGDILTVKAKDGVYDHPNQKLHLTGDVEVRQNADMTMETQTLDVNLLTRQAKSDQPVTGHNEQGDSIDAQGLDMTPGADNIVFKGPAKLILAPATQKERSE